MHTANNTSNKVKPATCAALIEAVGIPVGGAVGIDTVTLAEVTPAKFVALCATALIWKLAVKLPSCTAADICDEQNVATLPSY